MKKRTNDFDCVEMKNQFQQRLLAEYEAHKDEYESYVEFINKTAEKTDLMRLLKDKIAKAQRAA